MKNSEISQRNCQNIKMSYDIQTASERFEDEPESMENENEISRNNFFSPGDVITRYIYHVFDSSQFLKRFKYLSTN